MQVAKSSLVWFYGSVGVVCEFICLGGCLLFKERERESKGTELGRLGCGKVMGGVRRDQNILYKTNFFN